MGSSRAWQIDDLLRSLSLATIAFSVDNGMADEQTTGPPRPGVVN